MRRLVLLGLTLLCGSPLQAQERTRSPHGGLRLECKACHGSEAWTPARITKAFNHAKFGFRLQGAHETAACRACHESLDFKGAKSDCAACHTDVHRGELGAECARCHTPRGFQDRGLMLKAHQTTRFPLEGSHITVDCSSCHTPAGQGALQFVARATECVSCHERDFVAAKSPDHVASGIPRECVNCHAPTDWGSGKFNHDATRFPLTGAHRSTDCVRCHANNQYAGTPLECVACHQTDYAATTTPKHTLPTFVSTCTTCHSTIAWSPSAFNHDQTQFPLAGAHRSATCAQCHGDGVYRGKATTCVPCHQTDFNNTTTPKHTLPTFVSTCESCHTVTAWSPSSFKHDQTQFPLTGAHRAVTCQQCHSDGVYAGKATTCVSCHQTDYNTAANPSHSQARFPTDCTGCHTTTAWSPSLFDHGLTQFPLTGAHKAATCAQCHADGVYAGKPMTCASCHQTDYNTTTNPKHTLPTFVSTCQTCHTTTAWLPSSFNHDQTQFPLTGAHKAVTCALCHADGVYAGKPMACASCHQTDYNNTTNPKHTLPTFVATCQGCHTTTAWSPASFNHDQTQFPLTGAHKAATCAQCHADGVYAGKPTTCTPCHQTDYNNTTNPKHTLPTFVATCQSCHTTTAWSPASFNHDLTKFPLTGAHKAATCAQCHADGVYAGKPTTCVPCHQTDYNTTTNPKHTPASFPSTCNTCHTTTAWSPATFSHTWFRLPHHGINTCSDCHTNQNDWKVFACINCHTHSKTVVDGHHTQVNGYSYDSNACYRCHAN
jgi:hypothetical protein